MKHLIWASLIFAGAAASAQALPSAASAQVAPPTTAAPMVPVAPGQAVIVKPLPPAAWTPAQTRQAFDLADSDSNGELSRAEGLRLSILPKSFEEMDANKDGILSRPEYDATFRR